MYNSLCTLRRRAPRTRGFTLIEIMVVLAILGLLVGLAVTNLEGVFGSAQEKVVRTFVNSSMKTPLMAYKIDLGGYPTTSEGLAALCTAPQSASSRWRGPYVADGKIPLDPWNEPYQYAFPGKHNPKGYDLWSKGPDKQEGTVDDIGNWEAVSEGATGK